MLPAIAIRITSENMGESYGFIPGVLGTQTKDRLQTLKSKLMFVIYSIIPPFQGLKGFYSFLTYKANRGLIAHRDPQLTYTQTKKRNIFVKARCK